MKSISPLISPRILLLPTVAMLVGFFASDLQAADRTWSSDDTTANWSSTTNWGGLAAPGASGSGGNSDVATFSTVVGTVGTSGTPIIFDSAWKLGSIVFDTASVGSFVIGTTGGNIVTANGFATPAGFITVNSSVSNTQTFNAPISITGNSGNISLVNNAASSSVLLNIGGSITTTGANKLTLGGRNTGNNIISGVLSNGVDTAVLSLVKSGAGTWVLTGTNTYTGATMLQGGNLVLDYVTAGAPTSDIISSSSALTLGVASTASSQTLTINGKAVTANTQTLGAVSIGGGASHMDLNAGSGGTLALTLGALPNKVSGASLDLALSSGASVKVGTASAATGTGSGLFTNVITINGTDFATNNGSAANDLVGLATISGAYDTSTTVSATLTKALDVQGNTSITSTATLPAMRFNQTDAATVTISAAAIATIGAGSANFSGGILVTSNVGANTTTITGGSLRGVNSRDLSLIQNNVNGRLQVDSAIVNNGTTTLTKGGQGLALLTGTNTYTGKTYVNEGTLQFAKQVSLYNNTLASWTAANINVASGATLALNVGGSGEFADTDVAAISGLGGATTGFQGGSILGLDTTNASGGNFAYATDITDTNSGANAVGLKKLGTGTLDLSGTNTYTGATTVSAGTLLLSGGNINSTSGVSVASVGVFTNNSGTAFSTGLTLAEGAVVSGTGVFTPTAMTLVADLSNGFTTFALDSTALTKAGNLELTLSGVTGGTFTLFSGTAISSLFTTMTIGGVSLTSGGGGDFSGVVGGNNYTFTNSNNQLIVAIPEPTSALYILSGLGLLIGIQSLRKRQTGL